MEIEQIFTDAVSDEESLNDAIREIITAQTITLQGGQTLYPKPVDVDESGKAEPVADEVEVYHVGWGDVENPENNEVEYAIVLDLDFKPSAHFTSPAMTVMYKSRLYYMDAYAFVSQALAQHMEADNPAAS